MSQNSASPLVDASKENTTTVHIQHDPPRLSDASSSAAPAAPKKLLTAVERQKVFRERVGIDPKGTTPTEAAKASPKPKMKIFILMLRGLAHSLSFFTRMPLPPHIDTKRDHQFRARVEKAYQDQKHYYRLVASASHGLLWLQIAIGATLTALGQTNNNTARIAITVLGAVNTIIAGFLTFLKSRNQPNRALQFKNGLGGVVEDLWRLDAETGRDDFDVDKKVDDLWAKYKEVVQESEANYPDLWVSLDKMMKSADPTKNPSTHLQQISGDPTEKPKLVTRP